MKIRKLLAATTAAAVLSSTGALTLPALASTPNAEGTLEFTAKFGDSVAVDARTVITQEDDIDSHGKPIGWDIAYGTTEKDSKKGTVHAAYILKDGIIYATCTTKDGLTWSGTVTGGTEAYAGATGTIERTGTRQGIFTKITYKTSPKGLPLPTAASTSHTRATLTFGAVTQKNISFTRTTYGITHADANSSGTIIGFDALYGMYTGPETLTDNMAVGVQGGLLYTQFSSTNSGLTWSGTVTGGTGTFTGATGTITINSSSTVTITYS